ncbi:unnamed protein product [Boreogadus saida]
MADDTPSSQDVCVSQGSRLSRALRELLQSVKIECFKRKQGFKELLDKEHIDAIQSLADARPSSVLQEDKATRAAGWV